MIEIVCAVLGTGVLTTVLNRIFTLRDRKQNTDDGLKVGVRLLLLDSIKRQGKEYISDKQISHKDLESFIDMYNAYHALGGDGYADAVYKQVSKLTLTAEE